MASVKEKVRSEAKRIEEDSVYSAKRHFIAAGPWKNFHLMLGLPTAVLAAVAGVAAFSRYETAAGIIAIFVSALTAISTFLDPNRRGSDHMNAGNSYLALRNNARIFYEIESCLDCSDQDLLEKLKELSAKRDELNQSSSSTPNWAFRKARKSIESGEATYEIDQAKRSSRRVSTDLPSKD